MFLIYVVAIFYCCVVGSALPGGPKSISIDSPEVKNVAVVIISHYNKLYSKQATAFKVLLITSAQRQVVSGIKYFLKVKLGLTTCSKTTTGAALQSCPLKIPGMVIDGLPISFTHFTYMVPLAYLPYKMVLLCDVVVLYAAQESVASVSVKGCTKLSGR